MVVGVSIHAPRVGRDERYAKGNVPASIVSIHAPRVGRDVQRWCWRIHYHSFNPRAPRGARRTRKNRLLNDEHVSIHAPRVGRD